MPADPAAVPPPEDDDAEDARAIRDALADPYRVTFDEVVERLSDKQPPPEWAVKMVAAVGEDYAEELERLRQRGEPYEIGTNGLWYQMHARLLASVREGALREAARLCWNEARAWDKIPGTDNGAREVVCDDLSDAILALLHTPPSGGGGA